MAKAVFHKNQRVYVKPVGTWSVIEQIKPHWVKDIEEPVRIFYEVGLGRDFTAEELSGEEQDQSAEPVKHQNWRILRTRNKWQNAEECSHHPFPGTFPVVVTNSKDWGGWRTPGAEYDRDPNAIEMQARIMASGLRLLQIVERLADSIEKSAGDAPTEFLELAKEARTISRFVHDIPAAAPKTLSS
jgi:hypothetical protein